MQKESVMSKTNQTTQKDTATKGLSGLLRGGFQAGLGVAENMHQFTVEVPLNMLPAVGVSEETATELKDKHRNLLRGMYGSIDSVTTKAMDVGAEFAGRLTAEVRERMDDAVDTAKESKVVAEVEKEDA